MHKKRKQREIKKKEKKENKEEGIRDEERNGLIRGRKQKIAKGKPGQSRKKKARKKKTGV